MGLLHLDAAVACDCWPHHWHPQGNCSEQYSKLRVKEWGIFWGKAVLFGIKTLCCGFTGSFSTLGCPTRGWGVVQCSWSSCEVLAVCWKFLLLPQHLPGAAMVLGHTSIPGVLCGSSSSGTWTCGGSSRAQPAWSAEGFLSVPLCDYSTAEVCVRGINLSISQAKQEFTE